MLRQNVCQSIEQTILEKRLTHNADGGLGSDEYFGILEASANNLSFSSTSA